MSEQPPLRIRQYGCFTVFSKQLSVQQITEHLGLQPDATRVMGSVSDAPMRPVSNIWEIKTGDASAGVDELIADLLARLEPAREAIRTLLSGDSDATGELQIVRHFGDDSGEEEVITTTSEGFTKLAGQHQLLGWHLDATTIAFLAETGVELDVDEYG